MAVRRVLDITVNETASQLLVDNQATLLDLLRDDLRLWGVKEGCSNGNCGSCAVLLNGKLVNSCLVLSPECQGAAVTTVEGLAANGKLDPIQRAFVDAGALECGFCTPGFVMSSHALLVSTPDPSENEIRTALAGNLCRCTGYDKIVRAVQLAAKAKSGRDSVVESTPSSAPYRVIGKSTPKVAAPEMVAGKAFYGADVERPGMLEAAFLRSPHAHAKILRIDTSKAESLPGVRAVITRADYPPHNLDSPDLGGIPEADLGRLYESSMAGDKALFHGQPVAAVAADDKFVARRAAKLIDVEYEQLPAVVDVKDAMANGAPVIHDWIVTNDAFGGVVGDRPSNVAAYYRWELGDIERGFGDANVIVEGEYATAPTHQGYIEPQAAVAEWSADGGLTMWVTAQGAFNFQNLLAAALKMPLSKVRVIPMEVGGAFGGKIFPSVDLPTAVLSRKAGRPVRAVLNREEVLRATGGAAAAEVRIKAGCTNDGRITAMRIWCAYDAGCLPGSPAANGSSLATSAYRLENVHIEGYDVVTNKAKTTAYRAPGMPQITFAVEQAVDALAREIEMDPIDFRLRNVSGEGYVQANDVSLPKVGFRQVLEASREHPHWMSPRPSGPNQGRGVAVGFWRNNQNTSTCEVHVNQDGTVGVVMGAIDISGTRTALQQIAAEELNVDVDDVRVEIGDTQTAPFNATSAGSRITYSSSNALHLACQDVIEKLRSRAAKIFGVDSTEVEFTHREFRVPGGGDSISIRKLAYADEGVIVGIGSSQALPLHPTLSVNLCDVEVDAGTGRVKILRFSCLQDVGKAINPARIEAQLQGGAVQGLGWGLTEEVLFDAAGVVQNASLLDYRHLTSLDVPMIECEIIEVPAEAGPYGVRGVGEAPIIAPAAAVANAIRDATGIICDHAPMTPERLHQALHGQAHIDD